MSYFLGSHLDLLDQAKTQLIIPILFMVAQFMLHETPQFWMNRNNRERAIKSYTFYKGTSVTEAESVKFLSEQTAECRVIEHENYNRKIAIRQQIMDVQKKFRSPQAKRAFFISFSLLILSGGSWIFPSNFWQWILFNSHSSWIIISIFIFGSSLRYRYIWQVLKISMTPECKKSHSHLSFNFSSFEISELGRFYRRKIRRFSFQLQH